MLSEQPYGKGLELKSSDTKRIPMASIFLVYYTGKYQIIKYAILR